MSRLNCFLMWLRRVPGTNQTRPQRARESSLYVQSGAGHFDEGR